MQEGEEDVSHRDLGFGGFFEGGKLRFTSKAQSPTEGQRLAAALTYLGIKLNESQSKTFAHEHYLNAPDGRFNGVAAGYTYLLQLAAHDVLQSSRHVHPFKDDAPQPSNLRRAPLALETVFGGGPAGCPYAYDQPSNGSGVHLLRLGQFRDQDPNTKRRHPPAEDLPRGRFDPDGPEGENAPYTEVLIADARNDDNNILAQLSVLFHKLYNMLARHSFQAPNGTGTGALPERHRNRIARLATLRIYHRILRYDLLPKLMHPDVLALYDFEAPQKLLNLRQDEAFEHFAFAARVGHSMVRDRYRLNGSFRGELNRFLRMSSLHSPHLLPTPRSWRIDWKLFFPEPGVVDDTINWAIKLGPHFAHQMSGDVAAAKVDPSLPAGTPIRDLLADFHIRLRPVEALVEQLARHLPAVLSGDPQATLDRIITDGFETLRIDELGARDGSGNPVDLSPLRRTPPLFMYLLFEAQDSGTRGRTFGLLGSAIIGDCFIPLLTDSSTRTPDNQAAQALEDMTFPGDPICSMAALTSQLPAS
ncbi:hypothetical protein [uncultured Tateyamaria sp.]|uniref:hypothetical protein n=1 Tax=Tateyamaria sp. 1078 TaxID=3417464 RepID=UPI002624DE6A|nr:hypothetical protein [uncultured Tateyamaria sp.]